MPGIFKTIIGYHVKNKERAENYYFFKACMAAAALVAAADGRVDSRETAGLKALNRTLDKLKLYGRQDGPALYRKFVEGIQSNMEEGTAEAMKAVEAVKGEPEWAALLIAITAAMSEADGTVDESEAATIDRLCALLEIDRSAVESIDIDTKDALYD